MPNKPRADNPNRIIRMEDAVWARVRARAEADQTTASEVVRRAVAAYLEVSNADASH